MTPRTNILLSCSTGKDSAWALSVPHQQPTLKSSGS